MPKLIYKDTRSLRFMELSEYNCRNMGLSNPGQELNVSEREARYLLKMKNGKNPVFELKEPKERAEPKEKKAREIKT